jgi:hypothetical protein
MKEFLSFDTMLTPKLITIFYYLGLLGVLSSGLATITAISSLSNMLFGLIAGVLVIAIGFLFVRVGCEAWIVLFKMNDALQEIRKK